MNAYLFPGQGTQFPGMGKKLFERFDLAKEYLDKANEILGFSLTDVMYEATAVTLKQTKYAQPAIFLYSYIVAKSLGDKFKPDMVAGHSLGEISALAATGSLNFESALNLIKSRASVMQEICEVQNTGMAVVIGLYDVIVKDICNQIDGVVVPANYNALHQVVISGERNALKEACDRLRPGAKQIIQLAVGGAFHSPFMEPVVEDFSRAIAAITFKKPICPIYQNIAGRPTDNVEIIKKNLIDQLTNPVMWRHTILHMIEDGATEFTEIGPGNFLRGLVRHIDKNVKTKGVS